MAMFKPLRDYVLVKPDPAMSLSLDSGLIIPQHNNKSIIDSDRQYGRTGTIIAIGQGKRTKKGVLVPMEIKVGDRVMWGEFIFPEIELDGQIHTVLQEADLAVIDDE